MIWRPVIVRVAQLVPTFLGATVLTFALLHLAPGAPGGADLESPGNVGVVGLAEWQRWRSGGLSPLGEYLDWLVRLMSFDFGRSLIDERPVRTLIAEAAPATLLLTGSALVATYGLAVPLGVLSAVHRGRAGERVVSVGLFVLYSLPPFWVALLLVIALAGGTPLALLPLRGLASPGLADASVFVRLVDLGWHLVLPVACLTYPALARASRLQRSAMLDVLEQDYMRTARAKGLSPARVVWRHGLRNALVPMAALWSTDLPWLVGGSVIIERIFTIHGLGMLTFEAVLRRDYPVLMGTTALACLVTIAAMLLGDLLQVLADPRQRRSGRSA